MFCGPLFPGRPGKRDKMVSKPNKKNSVGGVEATDAPQKRPAKARPRK